MNDASTTGGSDEASPTAAGPPTDRSGHLRSVHTSNVPEWLHAAGRSLWVTTYQANHTVILRTPDGESLNTHFRRFDKPMGLAVDGDRLAIGAACSVWEFHNLPAVASQLPDAAHDACFLPRLTHWTGDIQGHEMAWVDAGAGVPGGKELWIVNTRFSCLCRRDPIHNFEPVWRPPFITQYAAEDRCHLNGIATRDGVARYVTAMAATDTAGGWRDHKRDGGIVIDLADDQVIGHGLSMPHSPRWYQDRLWVLNSGQGELGYLDASSGKFVAVAGLPGFTRGLTFLGPIAMVGLSQVRESAVFGGTEVAQRPAADRQCGVWMIDIESGATVGMVRFEDAVQEVFAVETLPTRFPELVIDNSQGWLSGAFELSETTTGGPRQ